jgi:hypothetical protein
VVFLPFPVFVVVTPYGQSLQVLNQPNIVPSLHVSPGCFTGAFVVDFAPCFGAFGVDAAVIKGAFAQSLHEIRVSPTSHMPLWLQLVGVFPLQ